MLPLSNTEQVFRCLPVLLPMNLVSPYRGLWRWLVGLHPDDWQADFILDIPDCPRGIGGRSWLSAFIATILKADDGIIQSIF